MVDQDEARAKDAIPPAADRSIIEPDEPDEPDTGPRPVTNFDPTPYLRQLRGRGGAQDYLDVKWRLLWLRREHPAAEIVTEHVRIDETSAIFKATVMLPTGGKATGYGSETAGDFGDFIEKAETKAIGRALNALGYGAQFAEESDDAAPPAPAVPSPPRPVAPPSRDGQPAVEATAPPRVTSTPSPRPVAEPPERPTPPIDLAANRERGVSAPAAAPRAERPAARPVAAPAAADEPNMADFTPTAFWSWAREQGLNRAGVETLIGRPVTGLTPADLRRLVLAAQTGAED